MFFRCLKFAARDKSLSLAMAKSSFKVEHPLDRDDKVEGLLEIASLPSRGSGKPVLLDPSSVGGVTVSLRAHAVGAAIPTIQMLHQLMLAERRQAESSRIREKYPDRIPVIVERAEKSDISDIDKKKYLVPADLTVGQFVYVVRKRINLSAEKAIFVFVKNILPPTAALMSAIYEENKDEDGFLYMTYSGENTFGFLDLGN
ncbi:hypothetical protein MTR67_011350 [Solanum verrucosum]|uniref:Autophagy-related protein n=1 Tax=Solanum verrucosum TaxID=315347 RepID=A0AAF0TLX0_SOLVR|nr:hypothetical protein MTR67_011350 [Solanum verrucosum]